MTTTTRTTAQTNGRGSEGPHHHKQDLTIFSLRQEPPLLVHFFSFPMVTRILQRSLCPSKECLCGDKLGGGKEVMLLSLLLRRGVSCGSRESHFPCLSDRNRWKISVAKGSASTFAFLSLSQILPSQTDKYIPVTVSPFIRMYEWIHTTCTSLQL